MTNTNRYDNADISASGPLLVRAFQWLRDALHILTDFVSRYFFGRPWWRLSYALPAIGAALIAVAAGFWIAAQSDIASNAATERRLLNAVAEKDLARQRICLKVLMKRAPQSPSYRFQYALLLREEGDAAAGQTLLERLAPENGDGYTPAHRLLAEQAMASYGEATQEADKKSLRRTAIRHLTALQKDREPQLDYRLGILCVEDGDEALAELHLKRAAEKGYAAAQMMLSQLQLLHGNPDLAGKLRDEARKTLDPYIADHPDDLEARFTWALCLRDDNDWENFTRVLSGLVGLETDAGYRDRLGRLALSASEAQLLASPVASQRAAQYAVWAFQMLRDRRQAASRLIDLASADIAVPAETMDVVRQWLSDASNGKADDPIVWILRGRCAALDKNLAAAKEAFERSVQLDPNALAELATFHRRHKHAAELAEVDRRVIAHFEPRIANKTDDALARVALAQAYADQGRWNDARQLLSTADTNPPLRPTLATICIRQFDAEAATAIAAAKAAPSSDPKAVGTRPSPPYELLRIALHNAPGYDSAFARLQKFAMLESERDGKNWETDNSLHRLLEEMLANGEQPADIHKILGTVAISRNDWLTAVRHFDQATRVSPRDAILLNNFAYCLLQSGTSDDQLQRAERMATEALQIAPDHPEILATRGEIRMRLKQYEAAIADLEKTLAALPDRADIRQSLAEGYDALGMKSMAETYRKKAKQSQEPKPAN